MGRNGVAELPWEDGHMLSAIRRTIVALGAAGLVALVIKLQGGESAPPLEGGWRELEGPDFR